MGLFQLDRYFNLYESKYRMRNLDDTILTTIEVMPEFLGGINELYKYLLQNLKFPEIAKKIGKYGKVFVQFVVCKDGS